MDRQNDNGPWLIVETDGRFLCCWIDGRPEWCFLRVNARRYLAQDAARALAALESMGFGQAEMVRA